MNLFIQLKARQGGQHILAVSVGLMLGGWLAVSCGSTQSESVVARESNAAENRSSDGDVHDAEQRVSSCEIADDWIESEVAHNEAAADGGYVGPSSGDEVHEHWESAMAALGSLSEGDDPQIAAMASGLSTVYRRLEPDVADITDGTPPVVEVGSETAASLRTWQPTAADQYEELFELIEERCGSEIPEL